MKSREGRSPDCTIGQYYPIMITSGLTLKTNVKFKK